jgi:hypothetical protein
LRKLKLKAASQPLLRCEHEGLQRHLRRNDEREQVVPDWCLRHLTAPQIRAPYLTTTRAIRKNVELTLNYQSHLSREDVEADEPPPGAVRCRCGAIKRKHWLFM